MVILFSPSIPSEEEIDTGWDSATISTETDLNDVAALNSTSAIAVGDSGDIFFTENSGVVQDLNSIEFSEQAIVVGDSGTVLISDGDSWIENSIEGAGNLYDLSVPHFESISNSTIFVSGTNGEIWKWHNNSWTDDQQTLQRTEKTLSQLLIVIGIVTIF